MTGSLLQWQSACPRVFQLCLTQLVFGGGGAGAIIEYYQGCSNDDLGWTLTCFYVKVKYGKMLERKISWKVRKILALKLVYTIFVTRT